MQELFVYLACGVSCGAVLVLSIVLMRLARSNRHGLDGRIDALERLLERQERMLRDEMAKTREELLKAARQGREESGAAVSALGDSLLKRMVDIASLQKDQLDTFAVQLKTLTASNEGRMDKLRETVEERLRLIQEDNARKLEQMRTTVDEKLHDTLEKRLGESFKLVSGQLEQVYKGLGEMQSLAVGVGDLRKVLTNVKTRGTLGEVQLHNLLANILTPDQYDVNVVTKPGGTTRVEFAIRLPGKDDKPLWLPIDAKFPGEDYRRLVEAQEQGSQASMEEATRQLDRTIIGMAKMISDKYIAPPNTTDFAIMYLANEAAYASVLSRPAIFDTIQRDYKVILAGPTTVSALLSALSLGFRTLTIEQRTSDIHRLLGAVRTEFDTFGALLDKTKKKLDEASSSIDLASTRQRSIQKKLKNIEQLPGPEATALLGMDDMEREESA